MWSAPFPRSTALVAACIWSGVGLVKTGAGTGGIEHAAADEASVHRLVAAAAAGDDGDLVAHRGVGADDVVRVKVDFDQVGVRDGHAAHRLDHDVLGRVDEFFHGDAFFKSGRWCAGAVTRMFSRLESPEGSMMYCRSGWIESHGAGLYW